MTDYYTDEAAGRQVMGVFCSFQFLVLETCVAVGAEETRNCRFHCGSRIDPISSLLPYRLIIEEIRSSLIFSTGIVFPRKPTLSANPFDGAAFCQEYASSSPSTCG